jgi:hypothetical protein
MATWSSSYDTVLLRYGGLGAPTRTCKNMARTGVCVLVLYELKRPISGFAGRPSMVLV